MEVSDSKAGYCHLGRNLFIQGGLCNCIELGESLKTTTTWDAKIMSLPVRAPLITALKDLYQAFSWILPSLLKNKCIIEAQLQKQKWVSSIKTFFTRQRAANTIALSKICGTLLLYQNVRGLRVNNSHWTSQGEVVVSFNEARKQFIWLDWPQAITLSALLSQ